LFNDSFLKLSSLLISSRNCFRVDKDDPRYLSGELVGICSKMVNVIDENNNIIRVSVDDENYKNGKYKNLLTGKKFYNNGIKNKLFLEHEVPTGWKKGMIKK
jgi:hypothetical protein